MNCQLPGTPLLPHHHVWAAVAFHPRQGSMSAFFLACLAAFAVLPVVLVCISLLTNGTKRFSMCSLTLRKASVVKCQGDTYTSLASSHLRVSFAHVLSVLSCSSPDRTKDAWSVIPALMQFHPPLSFRFQPGCRLLGSSSLWCCPVSTRSVSLVCAPVVRVGVCGCTCHAVCGSSGWGLCLALCIHDAYHMTCCGIQAQYC